MKPMIAAALPALAALAFAANAQSPQPAQFAWRAPVEVPAGASLVRVELPASALVRLQSAQAADVRVFNASGETVPFAWIPAPGSAAPAEEKTQAWPALPLYSLPAGARKSQGAVQVHVGGSQPVWVRVDGAPAAADAKPLESVLLDVRSSKRPVTAFDVEASIPPNTPVRLVFSTSRDLAQWTPVAVQGRIYRFEGQGAPDNRRVLLDTPLSLEGQYLRVDWSGQAGVRVASVTGVLAPPVATPRRLRAPLPPWRETSADAAELGTGFATPMAAIAFTTTRDNTLVPVRVLGRNDNSQPWMILGQTVVYRLGAGAESMTNPPLALNGASVRQLRIVSTNGAALAPEQIRAEAEFDPRHAVFVASGSPPFTLAVGHESAPGAALPPATLTGMLGARKVDELPLARLGDAMQSPVASGASWISGVANKTVALWAVLLIGVAVLGAVAWSLLGQMKSGDVAAGNPGTAGSSNRMETPS